MFTRWFGFVLGALVGAVAGAALLWWTGFAPELSRARALVSALGNGPQAAPIGGTLPSGVNSSRPGSDVATGGGGPFILGRFESELRQCLKLESPPARHQAVEAAVRLVDDPHLRDVLIASDALLPGTLRRAARDTLLRRWAIRDVQAAVTYAAAIGVAEEREQALNVTLRPWIERFGDPALAWVQAVPTGPAKFACWQVAARTLGSENPAVGQALLEQLPVTERRSELLREFYSSWAASDPAAAIRSVTKASRNPDASLVGMLLGHLAMTDLAQARQILQDLPLGILRSAVHDELLAILLPAEPSAAGEFVVSLSSGGHRNEMAATVAQHWAAVNPAAGVAWAQGLQDLSMKKMALNAAYLGWAERDPAGAAAAVKELPLDADTRRLLPPIAQALGKVSPQRALEWAAQFSTLREREAATSGALESIAVESPRTAVDAVMKMPAGTLRERLVASVAASIAARDPIAAAELVRDFQHGPVGAITTGVVIPELAKVNPVAALELIKNFSDIASQQEGYVELARSWADADLDAAVAWAKTLPAGETQEKALVGLLESWTNKDPAAAARFVETSMNPNNRGPMLAEVAGSWARQDPLAATDWASKLPAGLSRNQAVVSALSEWAVEAPSDAAEYVVKLPVGVEQTEAAMAVIQRWADADPETVALWIEQFPEGELREQAGTALLGRWGQVEPGAAGDWVGKLPVGAFRDTAAAQLAQALVENDAPAAFQWIGSISDATARDLAYERGFRTWLAHDPTKARQWMEQETNLPLTVQRRLKSLVNP